MSNIAALLKKYFGYASFREGQSEVVEMLLSGRDVLAVMPTGAGKSICFQLPALALEGVSLVISPLISLMKDQVNSLVQAGIPAAFLNSSLTERQYSLALENAISGKYKIIYVAPERLDTPNFIAFVKQTKISMLTVDEAHCISQWGTDFRPSYLKIPIFIASLPVRPVVSAFTATATRQVREDISAIMGLITPFEIVTGFDRKNLYYEVQKPADKSKSLLEIIKKHTGQSGIVYCSTRKAVEEIASLLKEEQIAAAPYHAGLPTTVRTRNQEDFLYDRVSVMVATNAFGMGIDKSDVRYVVHYNMPKDIESYYQEAGRAGRDGDPADCILLYGARDVAVNEFLIHQRQPDYKVDMVASESLIMEELNRLRTMTFYCHSTACLRQYVLRYFGEHTSAYCGNCFNCLHHFEEQDITIDAQKILSCVKRSGERFGMNMVIAILRGAKTERLLRLRLNEQTTYGLLHTLAPHEVRDRIQFLLEYGYLELSSGEFQILGMGETAGEVLSGNQKVVMKLVKKELAAPKIQKKRKGIPTTDDCAIDQDLFARLRALRMEVAQEQQVPAFVVFSDSTLRDMCVKRPSNADELLEVSGVGQAKLQKYGERFLEAIETF